MSNYFCLKKSSKMFERCFFAKKYWFFTIDALPFYAVIWKFHISVFFSVTLKRFFLFFHFWTFIFFSKMSKFQNHKLLFQITFFYKSSRLIKKYKNLDENNFLHFLKTTKNLLIFFFFKNTTFWKKCYHILVRWCFQKNLLKFFTIFSIFSVF